MRQMGRLFGAVFAFTGGGVDKAETTVVAIWVKADAIVSTLLIGTFPDAFFLASNYPRLDHMGVLPYFGIFQRLMFPSIVCFVLYFGICFTMLLSKFICQQTNPPSFTF